MASVSSAHFCGALLFATAVLTRPNLVLAAGVLLSGAVLIAARRGRWPAVAATCLGFALVLVSPLHNWIFGRSLVLFSDNVIRPETMRVLPSDYLKAVFELVQGDVRGTHLVRAMQQVLHWLSGPTELLLAVPIHAAAIAILLRVVCAGKFDPWLRNHRDGRSIATRHRALLCRFRTMPPLDAAPHVSRRPCVGKFRGLADY